MMRESRERKRLCKDISRHIFSRYPSSRKRTGENMVMNKVVSDINVLGMGRVCEREQAA